VADVPTKPAPARDSELTVGWVTVTYRSVFLIILVFILAAGTAFYFAFPKQSQSIIESTTNLLGRLFGKVPVKTAPAKTVGDQKAEFIQLDGSVKVKKKDANQWITADYNTPLEKGDVVQTGPEGMAKIVFADQTNYTVKQDSLIVIEENSTNTDQQTSVAVNVTTGTVDLTTGTYSQGSKSQVMVAGATASLSPESAAEVRNDPRADQHDILVKKGSGEITRNGETVSLSDYERVSFKADSPTMAKTKEVGPPVLIDPANMLPVFSTANQIPVKFTWSPVDGVNSYRIRISKNPYFTQLVMDKKVTTPEMQLAGLTEGAYYWEVQSVDAKGKESVESERNRFTIIPKNSDDAGLRLELDPFVQHGRIIEVRGKTDPSARVMVNGGEVPVIGADGHFQYLTPPLPNGENVITITAQNAKGGVATQTKRVVIQ
jgi:hypothetical protein